MIRVGRGDLAVGGATIRVRHFHDGDLGLIRSDPGSWKSEDVSVAAAVPDPAPPAQHSMPIGDAAFLYPDGGDAPSLEPEWWWATLPVADASADGSMAPEALPAGQLEILWHPAWAPPDGFEMDDADPCSW